ncbi:MAG: exodeoxyribonuclease VII small subunit [Pirellulales bacterium]|nr:exodeoxyribonuclease VII small subunit [Pirellulales bacterium]
MAKKTPSPEGPEALSFEDALARLEAIVHELEEGRLPLEDSLARYEEGVKLLRHAGGLLNRAERRIEILDGIDAEGRPITSPLAENPDTLEEKAAGRSRRRSAPSKPEGYGEPNHQEGGPPVDEPGELF